MAPTNPSTVERFLSGIPVPVQPATIERELAALWKPAGEPTQADAGHAVTRVCLANLIVLGPADTAAWQQDALRELTARFPCRVLWCRLDTASDRAALAAEVTAFCHLPQPGQPQVCSELILLATGRGGAGCLPSVALSLLEPDLPAVLWWALPAGAETALFDALCGLADRVIVHWEPLNSPKLRTTHAKPSLQLCLRAPALNKATIMVWHTMSHWRELTAQFFDDPQLGGMLPNVKTVTVRYATSAGQPPATPPAALYAGWLAGQLRWQLVNRDVTAGGLRATFATPASQTVEVELSAQPTEQVAPGRLMAVDIAMNPGHTPTSLHLTRVLGERMEIRQTLRITETRATLKSLPIVERNEAAVLGAAIESQSAGRVFPRAAKLALELLDAGGRKTSASNGCHKGDARAQPQGADGV
ncbi:MAG: glucose-6-phosphate dehydrogenase assembly protein OpcA [Verrucomicrobiae bacterium]|nr:glucose-6-phosphate dehydrogenase assembly protein OpcA [Verrucomicrobiae bacterium]